MKSKKRTADHMLAKENGDGDANSVVVDDLEARRRKDVLKGMEKIEREFDDLKERLFTKKIKDLQAECTAIMEGKKLCVCVAHPSLRSHPAQASSLPPFQAEFKSLRPVAKEIHFGARTSRKRAFVVPLHSTENGKFTAADFRCA